MQWNDSRVSSARHCQSRVFIRVIFPMNIFPMNALSNPSLPVIIYSMAIIYIEKGCNFVFCNKQRNRYSAIIFGTLVQCYPRRAKNLAASRNFCKNFFFSKFTLSTFFSTSIGLPAGTIRTLPRGGTLPCVVRRLWNIHIFSQLDSAAMFLEEMSNWLHIFCEFFYLRIL